MEGLTDLYSDVNAHIKELVQQKGMLERLKTIELLISKINEDMQMISRYVGLRVYLFNLRGKVDDAKRILEQY